MDFGTFYWALRGLKISQTNGFWRTTFSARKWWQFMEQKAEKSTSIAAEFCRLMWGLHSAPASSASMERIFSIHVRMCVVQAAQSLGPWQSWETLQNIPLSQLQFIIRIILIINWSWVPLTLTIVWNIEKFANSLVKKFRSFNCNKLNKMFY